MATTNYSGGGTQTKTYLELLGIPILKDRRQRQLISSSAVRISFPTQHLLAIFLSLLPLTRNLPFIRHPNSCIAFWQQLICWLVGWKIIICWRKEENKERMLKKRQKNDPTPALQRKLNSKLLTVKRTTAIDSQRHYRLRCSVLQTPKLYGC